MPSVLVGSDKESGSGNIMEALFALLLSDRFSSMANNGNGQPRPEEAEKLSAEIRKNMSGQKE